MRGRPIIDLTGQKFGGWTAMVYIREQSAWACRCGCGHGKLIGSFDLRGKRWLPGCERCDLANRRVLEAIHSEQSKRGPNGSHSRLTDRNNKVIESILEGRTFQDVAGEHGITKQRALQIWQKFATDEQKEKLKESFPKMMAVKAETGRSYISIIQAAAKLGLRSRNGKYTAEEVATVKEYISRPKPPKACKVCGKEGSWLCEGECTAKYRRDTRAKLIANGNSKVSRRGSMPDIAMRALEGVDPGEEYIQFKKAIEILGISQMQLSWLSIKRIIATRGAGFHSYTHPETEVKEYSLAHVMALKKALEDRDNG